MNKRLGDYKIYWPIYIREEDRSIIIILMTMFDIMFAPRTICTLSACLIQKQNYNNNKIKIENKNTATNSQVILKGTNMKKSLYSFFNSIPEIEYPFAHVDLQICLQ